jgi:chromosome segregation ATPase
VLDTHHSRAKLDELEAELSRCREALARFEESERETLAKIESSENELATKRGELDEIDARIGDARAAVQRLHSEMSSHRSRIEFNRQRAQEITELVERYTRDIAAAETKQTEQANQISEADAMIEKTNRLLESSKASSLT